MTTDSHGIAGQSQQASHKIGLHDGLSWLRDVEAEHWATAPDACQNGRKTAVTSGHARALRTASDLGMRRLTPCLKRPSKQQVVRRAVDSRLGVSFVGLRPVSVRFIPAGLLQSIQLCLRLQAADNGRVWLDPDGIWPSTRHSGSSRFCRARSQARRQWRNCQLPVEIAQFPSHSVSQQARDYRSFLKVGRRDCSFCSGGQRA